MALVRSDQKGLEEIQRIRVAMADGCPILTEAQRDLIKRQTPSWEKIETPSFKGSRKRPRQRGAFQRTSPES
jgi:hypothetical protein